VRNRHDSYVSSAAHSSTEDKVMFGRENLLLTNQGWLQQGLDSRVTTRIQNISANKCKMQAV
jgi:hypothetical protein